MTLTVYVLTHENDGMPVPPTNVLPTFEVLGVFSDPQNAIKSVHEEGFENSWSFHDDGCWRLWAGHDHYLIQPFEVQP
jgi:hypothetical protein